MPISTFPNKIVNQSTSLSDSAMSAPTTPSSTKKFQPNFRPLDLRKITFYGYYGGGVSQDENIIPISSSTASCVSNASINSFATGMPLSRETLPLTPLMDRRKQLIKARHTYHSCSQDSFLLKSQSSQNQFRESLAALILPKKKEIEFTVPQTSMPSAFGRKRVVTGDYIPPTLTGSRSNTEENSTSKANSSSPVISRMAAITEFGGCFNLGSLNPELYKSNLELDEENGTSYPENHVGRIWFGLEYDTESERLIVALIKARNLLQYGDTATFNLIVRVALLPDEKRTLQSQPQKSTLHPNFNEKFGFQISRIVLNERCLKLSVYDVDENSKKHNLIGYLIQPLKDIDWSVGMKMFKEDLLKDNGKLPQNTGEILVSLCYKANLSRLTVTIFEAKGIKSQEAISGLYCKIYLKQHTKVLKTKKSEIVQVTECGVSFNQSFNFKLEKEILDFASVSIQLMSTQPGYNKDQPVGSIVLGSFMLARGKGLDHWTEMVSKQKEQIQYWHTLSE